jgi:hypothetical protein
MFTPAMEFRLWMVGLMLTVTLPAPTSLMFPCRVVWSKLTVPPPVPILICIELNVESETSTPLTVVMTPLSLTSTVFKELSQLTVNTWLVTLMLQDGMTRGSNSSRRSGERRHGSVAVRRGHLTGRGG